MTVVPPNDASTEAASLDAGDGATAPFPLGQTCAPVSVPTDACAECSQSNCCDTLAALKAFPDANDLATCVGAKTCDTACEDACFAKYPAPTQALLDHAACKTYRCTGTCTSAPDTCTRCTNAKCLPESLACDRSKECFLYTGCAAACVDQTCVDACGTKYPDGRTLGTAFTKCSQTLCQAECR